MYTSLSLSIYIYIHIIIGYYYHYSHSQERATQHEDPTVTNCRGRAPRQSSMPQTSAVRSAVRNWTSNSLIERFEATVSSLPLTGRSRALARGALPLALGAGVLALQLSGAPYYTILYTIYYILYTIYYILYTIYYILYTIYYILYTLYYILYTILYYTIHYIIL